MNECISYWCHWFCSLTIGIEHSDVAYSMSKKAADDYLATLVVKSIILRPSFIYGRGSYGGSSLFRGLAGFPLITPIPGKGAQEFQPIHLQDLSQAVLKLLAKPIENSMLLHAVSAKRTSLTEVLTRLRAWLGFPKTKIVFMPLWMIRIAGYFGDFIPYSPISSDSYKLLMQNNITSSEETNRFAEQVGFKPREFNEGVVSEPSTVQDHWHAKLFFLKPLLKLSLVFIWVFTALCTLFFYSKSASMDMLGQMGISHFWQPFYWALEGDR